MENSVGSPGAHLSFVILRKNSQITLKMANALHFWGSPVILAVLIMIGSLSAHAKGAVAQVVLFACPTRRNRW
jgi:hypothetical protein